MGGVRVLVTRPQPGANRTAARLASLGYEPVVMPLTQTVALMQHLPEAKPDLVVATSPQAFHHLSQALRDLLANVLVIVTGDGTATAAREAGLARVETAGGNVAGLVDRLSRTNLSDVKVVYLAGRVRRPDLEIFLRDSANIFKLIEVYDTISVSYSTDNILKVAAGASFASVLLTSAETVTALGGISGEEFNQAIENAQFICLSGRIAEAARSRFRNPIAVALEPTEDSLLDCLMKAFPPA
jgi:uroporphyrinogen-III synthase